MAAHSRAEELIQRCAQTGEIRAPRQPVVTFLDKSDRDVPAPEALGEAQACLPGNGVVEHAVQQPHRAYKRDFGAHHEMAPSVFEQSERMGVAIRIIPRGQRKRAGLPKLLALRRIQPPMLEPIRICRPSVSASRTAIASSDQQPIVPTPMSPLDAPCPK